MKLTDEDWNNLGPWPSKEGRPAPRAVYGAVAALVAPQTIVQSFSEAEFAETTTWIVHVISDTSIAHVRLSFDVPIFDRDEEDSGFRLHNPPNVTVVQSWVRPLTSIVEFSVDDLRTVTPEGGGYDFLFSGVVRFDDGSNLKFPALSAYHRAGRSRLDDFYRALRDAIARH